MIQMTFQVFLALYLAHLIGDFPLQSSWMVINKSKTFKAVLAHAAIHYVAGVVLLTLFVTNLFAIRTYWVVGLLVIAHLAIDEAKSWMTAQSIWPDNSLLFLADQLSHLLTVGVASLYLTKAPIRDVLSQLTMSEPAKHKILIVGVIYVGVVFAGGYLIRYLTKSLARDLDPECKQSKNLQNAGLYIGWLERFLVLTAIIVQSPTIVGLILTGKSIARFPELKEPKFAEYFLIGTFLSVSLAMLGGLALSHLLWGTASLK